MLLFSLKRLSLCVLTCASVLFVKAQQLHYIYLQTENAKPFYVKLDNKVVSSSANGYLIIPKLIDGDYKLSIGFPKKEFPEEEYQITVNNKDEGFLLKNFNDKGWGLFDMQSYAVTMGGNLNIADTFPKNLQNDAFSKMLANVVKDSSILQKNEVVKEINLSPKNDSISYVAPVVAADSQLVPTNTLNVKTGNDLVSASQVTLFSPATKILSKKNKDGIEMIFIDYNMDKDDTIKIFMDNENETFVNKSDSFVLKGENYSQQHDIIVNHITADSSSINLEKKPIVTIDSTIITSNQVSTSENKEIKSSSDSVENAKELNQTSLDAASESTKKEEKNISDTSSDKITVLPQVVKSSPNNSDCKAFANDEDFLKLRKKMASESSDDDMIKIAKKSFHSKCFSTEQIKNLSFLFLSDKGKYMFFDSAYPFAADSNQFFSLQSQLSNTYYINRFKAMINQ